MSLFFDLVDDAFIQSIKDVFGGDGNKKNLVDPFLEARFAGRKVPCFFFCLFSCSVACQKSSSVNVDVLFASAAVYSDYWEECKPRVEPKAEPPSKGNRIWICGGKMLLIKIDKLESQTWWNLNFGQISDFP